MHRELLTGRRDESGGTASPMCEVLRGSESFVPNPGVLHTNLACARTLSRQQSRGDRERRGAAGASPIRSSPASLSGKTPQQLDRTRWDFLRDSF